MYIRAGCPAPGLHQGQLEQGEQAHGGSQEESGAGSQAPGPTRP